jgi:large subunit ribosomal protein L19
MDVLEKIEQQQMKKDLPAFRPGDAVRVHVKIKEGDKERIQVFEGMVISLRRARNHSSFTVRKMSFGHGVERIFPLHSPVIDKIEVVRPGRVRRAKLYYLRGRRGKAARLRAAQAEQKT